MKQTDSTLVSKSPQAVCIIRLNTPKVDNTDLLKRFYGQDLFAHISVDLEKDLFFCNYLEKFLRNIPEEGRFSDLAGILARYMAYPDDWEGFYCVLDAEYLYGQFQVKRKDYKNKSYYLDFRSMQAGEIKRCRMILVGEETKEGEKVRYVHLALQNTGEKETGREKNREKEMGRLKYMVRTRRESVKLPDLRKERNEVDEFMEMDFSGRRILLADDNNVNRRILAEILRTAGVAVKEAGNGREVIEYLRPLSEGGFDMILLDISMPFMNGYDTARAVRKLEGQKENRTPIIAMTANVFEEDAAAVKKAGMDGYIMKPIDFKELKDMMKKWLKKESVLQ